MFPLQPDKKQETFIQEHLYIDDIYFEQMPQKKEEDESEKRGIIIIDIYKED